MKLHSAADLQAAASAADLSGLHDLMIAELHASWGGDPMLGAEVVQIITF
jgi:hypothetical protein